MGRGAAHASAYLLHTFVSVSSNSHIFVTNHGGLESYLNLAVSDFKSRRQEMEKGQLQRAFNGVNDLETGKFTLPAVPSAS